MSVHPETDLLLVGLSHRTATVELRERFACPARELAVRLEGLREELGLIECWGISTCNRTEVLVVAPRAGRLREELRRRFFKAAPPKAVYSWSGVPAVIHLFRVAAGLDSQVLGESEILGQLKESLDACRARKTLGKELEALLQQALTVGKRVRNETGLGLGTLSVARVGVSLAERVFGRFEDCHALLVGAGETARLVAQHLSERGVAGFSFANRTPEHASEAAAAFRRQPTRHGGLDLLEEFLRNADVVFACVDGGRPLIGPEHFTPKLLRRRDRPMLVVDLSVPHAVSPEVGELDGVLYYDLDDLQQVIDENRRERQRASEESSAILISEVHKFFSLRTYAAFSPAIAALRQRFEEIRETALDELVGGQSKGEEMRLAHELTRRLLDVALEQLKESARRARPEETLEGEYRAFLEDL